jgi:hypothetical protein
MFPSRHEVKIVDHLLQPASFPPKYSIGQNTKAAAAVQPT